MPKPPRAYAARPIRREFVATVADSVARRHAGLDARAKDVIRAMIADYEMHPDCRAGGRARRHHAGASPDLVVWEGNRVVAVLRPSADGGTLEVVRFDAPPAPTPDAPPSHPTD